LPTFSFSFGFVCLWQKVGIKKRRETNSPSGTKKAKREEKVPKGTVVPLLFVSLRPSSREEKVPEGKQKEGGNNICT
jgi:hypothetical protein